MSDGHLVQKAWLENVGFVQSQIVEMIVGRPINWSCFRQAAAAILIHKRFPKDICCKAEPVFRGEIVIDATVIDVICVRLWVKERDASDLKARTRARWFIWARRIGRQRRVRSEDLFSNGPSIRRQGSKSCRRWDIPIWTGCCGEGRAGKKFDAIVRKGEKRLVLANGAGHDAAKLIADVLWLR